MDGEGDAGEILERSLVQQCPPSGRKPLKVKRRTKGGKEKEARMLAQFMSKWLAPKCKEKELRLEERSGTRGNAGIKDEPSSS